MDLRILRSAIAALLLTVAACTPTTVQAPDLTAPDLPTPTKSARATVSVPTGASSPESASAGSDDERLDRRGWNLDEITADGMFVAVSIFYGGCDRYVGTEVEEPGEEVRITTIFAVPRGVNACNDMLRGAREIMALQRPLNDRELRMRNGGLPVRSRR